MLVNRYHHFTCEQQHARCPKRLVFLCNIDCHSAHQRPSSSLYKSPTHQKVRCISALSSSIHSCIDKAVAGRHQSKDTRIHFFKFRRRQHLMSLRNMLQIAPDGFSHAIPCVVFLEDLYGHFRCTNIRQGMQPEVLVDMAIVSSISKGVGFI